MPAVAIFQVLVVPQYVGERESAFDDELGVAVEQTEESPLARHETGNEVHCLRRPFVLVFFLGAEFSGSGGAVTVTS